MSLHQRITLGQRWHHPNCIVHCLVLPLLSHLQHPNPYPHAASDMKTWPHGFPPVEAQPSLPSHLT